MNRGPKIIRPAFGMPTTGEELLVIEAAITSLYGRETWSPDGRRIATFSNDGTVKIWDAITGDELLTLSVPALYSGHTCGLQMANISPL
jgi:WD40 repeat protein